jgi:WD40 repeat protein
MVDRTIQWKTASMLAAAAICICTSSAAERSTSKYKKGDRIEVRDGFDWKPAIVVSVDNFSGWVDASIEKVNGGRSEKRSFPPSNVRASRAPKPRPVTDAPLRKWNDRSGKFSVEARYQGLNGDKVVLAKSDGKRIEVPTAKLSDEDARYLLEVKTAGESPFQEVGDDGSTAVAVTPSTKVDWSAAKVVDPQDFQRWMFKPSSSKGSLPTAGRAKANVALTDIPDSQVFFETVEGIYGADDGNHVVVCRNLGDVHQTKAMFLEVVDIQKQHAGGLIALPETTKVLDVDPNSNLVMYCPANFGSGDNGVLSIARIEGGKLVPMQQWEPYADEDFKPSRDIDKAWFLTDNRVMTINGHGKMLTVWDVSKSKAIFNIPVAVSFALELSLSPDRQVMAVIMKEGIALIDLAAGRHVATIPTTGRHYRKVAIRGDNTALAGLSDEGVTVWNLIDGKVTSEFYGTASGWNAGLQWADNYYLLADGRYLFDVDRRILLWEYRDPPGVGVTAKQQNGRLNVVANPQGEQGKFTLISFAVPHSAVAELASRLPAPEALLVVKPGDKVAIEVDIDPSVSLAEEVQKYVSARTGKIDGKKEKVVVLNPNGAQNDVVRQMLASALEEAGLKVVDHSDLVVKAVCKPQPTQTICVNVDGRFPPRPEDFQERTVTPHASYLEMSLKGEVLWKRGFIAQPNMVIWIEKGETLDKALERLTKPNASLFTNAKFSPYVAKPGKATTNGAYGVSRFTARGLVDDRATTGKRATFE